MASPPSKKKQKLEEAAVNDVFGGGSDSDDDQGEEEANPATLIREAETNLAVGDNTYTFHLQLLEIMDEGIIREVAAKMYVDDNDNKKQAAKNDSEEKDDGEEVGYLSGFLISRPEDAAATTTTNYYDLASSVSDELGEVVTLLCNPKGHVTKLREYSGTDKDSFETKGGILHVSALEIKGPGYAGTGQDLGLHLVDQTLEFVKNEWSLAVLVPLLLDVNTMKWPDHHNRLKIDPFADSHSKEQTEGLKQAHVAIKRHFARMGFAQAGRNSEQHHVFCLPACDYNGERKWKTKEEIRSLDVFVAPPPYEPSGANAQLHALLRDAEDGETDMGAVRKLMEQGATLHGSRALFLTAAEGDVELMERLLETEKKNAVVNQTDENGNAPLHVAAMMVQLEVVQYLLKQGASKTIQNDKLHTPFDTLQESIELALASEEEEDGEEKERRKTCQDLLRNN